MGFFYSISEGMEGFRRAKASSFISISAIAISLLLVGIFLVVTANMAKFIGTIRAKVDLEAFIDNSFDDTKIETLEQRIKSLPGVQEVQFVSKEKAALNFRREYGADVFSILDENPLPASFRILLTSKNRSSRGASEVAHRVGQLEGIDEVVFRRELLNVLDRYVGIAVMVDLGVGLLVCIGAVFLVANTIRLIIMAKQDIIQIMKLVGATPGFIRRPFLIEGLLQGFWGGVLAVAVLYGLGKVVNFEVPGLIEIGKEIYWGILLFGLVLGVGGSFIAVRRVLK